MYTYGDMETTQDLIDWVNEDRTKFKNADRAEIIYCVGNLAADRDVPSNMGRALNAQAETLRMLADLGACYLYQRRHGDPIRAVHPEQPTRTMLVYNYEYCAKRAKKVRLPIIQNRQQLKSVYEKAFPKALTSSGVSRIF